MIKLFRKIRQKLLTENKFSKYLIYAIGEILLVVIGILIALQINNWNENQKARQLELVVMKDLRSEFIMNKKVFDTFNKRVKSLQTAWSNFLEEIAEKRLNQKSPNHGAQILSISDNVLSSILNSGKVDIFENDSLKYLLSNWAQDITIFRNIEDRHVTFVENDLRAFERPRKISRSWNYGGEDRPNPLGKLYTEDDINSMNIKLYADLEYHNLLMTNFMWLNLTLMRGEKLAKNFDSIIHLLDQEIDEDKKKAKD